MGGALVKFHALADVGEAERAIAFAEEFEDGNGAVKALQLVGIGGAIALRLGLSFLGCDGFGFLFGHGGSFQRDSQPPSTGRTAPVT
jgi:hypothetical protein